MGKLLQIRVSAWTYREEDFVRAWPALTALALPRPQYPVSYTHLAQNKPDDGEAGKAASGQEREETVQHGPAAQRLPRRHHDGPDDGAAKQKARRKVQARLIQRGERCLLYTSLHRVRPRRECRRLRALQP